MENMKLVNKHRENGGSWTVAANDARMLAYIKKELAAYQSEEPANDWHLETRGSSADWHRFAA